MEDKIKIIKRLSQDADYLRNEYETIKLWGSCPDGDVKFDKLMEWLVKNDYLVEHMIKVSKEIHSI